MACLNPAYGGTSSNERAILTRRSTSTHSQNIKPQSGTFGKHIMTISTGRWLQSTGISGLGCSSTSEGILLTLLLCLRIHPWWKRGRVKAHISRSKLGAFYSSRTKKKNRLQAARPVTFLRKRKYLWLILRLMICLEHFCRLCRLRLYTGRFEMDRCAC